MGFNFNEVLEVAAVNSVAKQLEGNTIHKVKFDGCEATDFKSKTNDAEVYKVIRVKFSNDQGVFTHTIWEPKPEDYYDQETPYKNPSNVKSMMQLIRHLLASVNPTLLKQIEAKETTLDANTWDGFRKNVVEATNPGIGTEVEIKLLKNKKGEAIFPAYFLQYDREGRMYFATNFIGHNLVFSNKETRKIQQQESAAPTNMDLIEETQPDTSLSFDL